MICNFKIAVPSPVGDAKNSVPGNYYFHTKYGSDSNKVLLKAITQNVKI